MLMRFWRWLVGGCEHKWKVVSTVQLRVFGDPRKRDAIGVRYTLQCDKCGTIKKRDVI